MNDIINQINGQVQIIFEMGTETQCYRDAIWMSQSEYNTTSPDAIEAIKQERYNNWLAVIAAMPTEAPTP